MGKNFQNWHTIRHCVFYAISADFDADRRKKTTILRQFSKLYTILLYDSRKIVNVSASTTKSGSLSLIVSPSTCVLVNMIRVGV